MEMGYSEMGMTERQFDAYQSRVIRILKMIEEASSESVKQKLRDFIAEMEAELKRP